jgi:hypothetical protein
MPKGNPGIERGPKPGSRADRLGTMQRGDVHWLETTADTWINDMKNCVPARTRRTGIPASREFTTAVYTAIGSAVGDIRYLIRIERVN